MNIPLEITQDEWAKIMKLPQVKDAWNLSDSATVESFSIHVFAVKFSLNPKSPHAPTDLYLLYQGIPYNLFLTIYRFPGDIMVGD